MPSRARYTTDSLDVQMFRLAHDNRKSCLIDGTKTAGSPHFPHLFDEAVPRVGGRVSSLETHGRSRPRRSLFESPVAASITTNVLVPMLVPRGKRG